MRSRSNQSNQNPWTLETLFIYFESHLAQLRDETKASFVSLEKVTGKAEAGMEKRLDQMNEFRNQLKDQAATFISRTEYTTQHEALAEKVVAVDDGLLLRMETLKLDADKVHARMDTDLGALRTRFDNKQGEETGADNSIAKLRGFIASSAAALTVIISIVVLVANGKLGG